MISKVSRDAKMVNLYSEQSSKPENVDVSDENSVLWPSSWSKFADDPNCVAIVAGWGEIRKYDPIVRSRRIEVAEWLNRNHSEKVGHLGLSQARFPYHPNSDVFKPPINKRPHFYQEAIPEI